MPAADPLTPPQRELIRHLMHDVRRGLLRLQLKAQQAQEQRADCQLDWVERECADLMQLLAQYQSFLAPQERLDLVDLRLIVAEVCHQLSPAIEVLLPSVCVVSSWPRDLRLAVDALIRNAVEHGEFPLRVSLKVSGADVELRVDDSGAPRLGIEQNKLQQAFFRAPSKVTRPGAGLGLTLALDLASRHGGTLHTRADADGFHACLSLSNVLESD